MYEKENRHTLRSHFFISVLLFCDIHVLTSYHSCATNSRKKLETLQCDTYDVLASTCDFVYIVYIVRLDIVINVLMM